MTESESVVYLCRGRLDGRDFIFFWKSDKSDAVLTDNVGAILAFSSEAEAREQAQRRIGVVAPEPAPMYDFDRVREWCVSVDTTVDCHLLLDTWNILSDVPHQRSLFDEADARVDVIYEKLVIGCEIPALTVSGKSSPPSWSASEIAALKRLLLLGINEFRSRVSLS
jgi:hypothetical protein